MLDTDDERAELSEGSALAFRCEKHGLCKHATAVSDDPEIADVMPANLARLDEAFWNGHRRRSGERRVAVTCAR